MTWGLRLRQMFRRSTAMTRCTAQTSGRAAYRRWERPQEDLNLQAIANHMQLVSGESAPTGVSSFLTSGGEEHVKVSRRSELHT